MTSRTPAPRTKNPRLVAALQYATKRHWKVFALNGKKPFKGTHGHNEATTDPEQIRAWWKRWPLANVGIACDSTNGPIVVDVDGPTGAKFLTTLKLPRTRTATSGKANKQHLYFDPMADGTPVPRMIRPFGPDLALDVLGDGGYVVAPPSVHPDTGREYKWIKRLKLKPFPRALYKRLNEPVDQSQRGAAAPSLPAVITEGERDSLLTSLAGSMRRRGASKAAILAALRAENETRVQPPLSDKQLRKIARSIGNKEDGRHQGDSQRVVVRLSDVEPEAVAWLVPGVLPLGKFALIEGDPGQGKSTLTLDIAARITTGRPVLGKALNGPQNVVLVTYEDGLADTVRPRVDAMGGDANRIFVFRSVWIGSDLDTERQPSFPEDIQHLRAIVDEHHAALVIVDPLGAALTERSDSHNDASVRRVVAPLARLAEETGACVLGVRHLAKGTGANAVNSGIGSIGFIGAARVALLVAEHPDDAELPQDKRRRVVATVKNNLAPHPPSQMFTLVQPKGRTHPRVKWGETTTLSANDLVAARATMSSERRSVVEQRCLWLRAQLAEGPKGAAEVCQAGRAEHGWSEDQLLNALHLIGGRTYPKGRRKMLKWWWEIPATVIDVGPAQ